MRAPGAVTATTARRATRTRAVVKVGGRLVEDPAGVRALARSLAASGARGVVIVHGGGGEVSSLSRRLGRTARFHDGQRVTDEETLRLVSMVLSGEVNKRLVRALLDEGVAAAGLSGEDGGTIHAGLARDGALGRVGHVREVRTRLLDTLLAGGFVPVLSPVSLGPDGAQLNVNADAAAVAVAVALGAGRLLFLSDVDAVRDGAGAPLASVSGSGAAGLIASGAAAAGMVPKLAAAIAAARAGIPDVRIGGLGALGGEGTRVVGAPESHEGGAPPGASPAQPPVAEGSAPVPA